MITLKKLKANPKVIQIPNINLNINIDKPLHFFCGLFLQFFHEIIVLNEKTESVANKMLQKLNVDDNRIKDAMNKVVELLKLKFNSFLKQFWNHTGFLKLLHINSPLESIVEGVDDGFEFIISTLSTKIFDKVFMGKGVLENITFQSYDFPDQNYTIEIIRIITQEGIY